MRRITAPFSKLPPMFRQYGIAAKRNTNANLSQVVSRVKSTLIMETQNAIPASPRGGYRAVDTGRYLRNWKVNKSSINGARGVLITNMAKYMAVIERGRTPGAKRPPVNVIAKWAQRRLGLSFKEAKKAAFPIANAIKARGLFARKVMTGDNPMWIYRETMRELMGIALDEASIKVFV